MTRYYTKSLIVGRKKRKSKDLNEYPCFVSFFSKNNPHTAGAVPDKILEFEDLTQVIISDFDVHYLLAGNDLLINDIDFVDIEEDKAQNCLLISGKHKK